MTASRARRRQLQQIKANLAKRGFAIVEPDSITGGPPAWLQSFNQGAVMLWPSKEVLGWVVGPADAAPATSGAAPAPGGSDDR